MTQKNKQVVLITGASRGLGRAIAELLHEDEQYVLYGTARDPKHLPQICTPLKLDLSCEGTIVSAVDQIISEQGRIDVLINNAGIAYYSPVDAMTLAEFRHLFEVNVAGTFRLTQLVLPYMRHQRRGKVLFVSSIRGVESHAYMGAYAATKAAIESIAFDWAVTLRKWNIEVSVVQPGPLDTGIKLKEGSYFKTRGSEEDPYVPYADFNVKPQSVAEAAKVIVDKLSCEEELPLLFQTSADVEKTARKHVVDASRLDWFNEQLESMN